MGQTKIVEDALRELRDKESRDATNKRVTARNQWCALRDRRLIALHKRTEIEAPEGEELAKHFLKDDVFSFSGHQPSVDANAISGQATWPTLTAQTSQGLSPERALMARCYEQECFEDAEQCWRANFVPAGSILFDKTTSRYVLAAGVVGMVAHVGLPLRRFQDKDGVAYFPLKDPDGLARRFEWIVLTSWEDFDIVPTTSTSPARLYLRLGCRLQRSLGVCLLQVGDPEPIKRYAAKNAFWELPQSALTHLANDEGVARSGTTLYSLVGDLVRHVLKPISDAEVDSILSLRGIVPKSPFPEGLSEEVIEDCLGAEEAKEVKGCFLIRLWPKLENVFSGCATHACSNSVQVACNSNLPICVFACRHWSHTVI